MRLALSFLLTFALMTLCQGMLKKFHVDGGSKEKTNVQSVHGGSKERTHIQSIHGGRGSKERTYEQIVHGGRGSKERTHEQSVHGGRGSKERTNTQRNLNNGGEKTEKPKVIATQSPDAQKPVSQVGTKSFSLLGSLLNPINQIVGGAVDTGVNLFCAVVGKLIPCKDASDGKYSAPLPFKCRTIADVIFVVDSSGSIGPTNFKKQLSFIANIVASFNVGADDVRIGLVVFSTNAEIWFDLRKYSDLLSLQKAILNVPYEGEATYTDKGLRLISSADMFNRNKGGRVNAPDVVIVLTDGQSTNPTGTLTEAMKLKSQGVKMLSVGISSYIQKSELLSMASSPEYFFEADDFDTLSSILGGFVEKTCTASEGVKVSVQTETERYIEYDQQQQEPEEYGPPLKTPRLTTKSTTTAAKSTTTRPSTTTKTTTTTSTTTTTTPRTTTTTTPKTTTTTTPKTTTTTTTTTTTPRTTTTTTPQTTTTTTTTPKTTTTTTPKSTTTTTTTTTTPRTTTTTTPKTTTTTTPKTTTTTTPKTTTTTTTTTTTPRTTTTTTPKTTTTTTPNTTTTTTPNTTTTTTTTTTPRTTKTTTTLPPPPSVIPCYNTTKADIILLIDASTSIGPDNWLKQAKFASELVQAFTVGPKDVLFGCLIFNRTPTKIFDLKTYMNSTSASNSLLSIPYPNNQGTNTHLGLSEIRVNQLFSPASGGRTDARDLVIVMTDGQSNSPDLTKSEAQQLKDTGVSIITVGIGLSNTNELTAMASKHEYVFNTGGYDMLDYIKRDLVKLTCEGV